MAIENAFSKIHVQSVQLIAIDALNVKKPKCPKISCKCIILDPKTVIKVPDPVDPH